jgi:capsule polysaccharide export protein KpsE/RkpR
VVNKGLKTQQASFQRKFIEVRYKQNIEDLKNAEDRLKSFQKKNNMISLSEQTQAAIIAAATIKGKILANEVQLGVMNSTLNSQHPDIDRVEKETEELQQQLRDMDYGSNNIQSNQNNLFPIFSEVPELGVQLMRLKRDVNIQNTLFTFLTQQYEEAKIQEAKDTPTVQVLDKAVSADKKAKPRRKLIVFMSIVISAMLSVAFIIISDNSCRVNLRI